VKSGEPRIKRFLYFAEGHGVFADYRDDFSLLDKIKQVFPEIVGPNRAHPQFVAGCQSAEPASVSKLTLESVFTALVSIRHFGSAARTCAAAMSRAASIDRPLGSSLASLPRMASLC
jgi:hypothetical protein